MPVLDKRRILQGSASNLTRVILGMLISLVLPHFLVQHLGTAEYSAWVLILQLSAYVNFLDLGLQTAIGKFVAEYNAAGNSIAARKTVSTAFTVMLGAAHHRRARYLRHGMAGAAPLHPDARRARGRRALRT